MGALEEIVEKKKERLRQQKAGLPMREVKARALDRVPSRDFLEAVRRPPGERIRFVGELKRASPSKGIIREEFNPIQIASVYERKGASALSVITEEDFFLGSIDYLREVSRHSRIPVLRKDFIFEEYQVYEACAFGADAILLIAALLSRNQAHELYDLATELGMAVLFEVHHWKELEEVLLLGAPIVGINNRDLKTLKVDLRTTFELLKDIPEDRVVVSESGINTRADVEAFESTRVDALLIGTVFMEAESLEEKIDELFPPAQH